MKGRVATLVLSAITLGAMPGSRPQAHTFDPALLIISERASGLLDVVWKYPTASRAALKLRLPASCVSTALDERRLDAVTIETSTMSCREPLAGQVLAVDYMLPVQTDIVVQLALADRPPWQTVLRPAVSSARIPETAETGSVLASYVSLGAEHITFGFDHLLFVLCLMLVAGRLRALLLSVTGFTLGHSLTLAALALDWIEVSARPVEILIALSIVVLAREIVVDDRTSLSHRATWVVAAVFGLLHGLGFGGALRDIGLPASEIWPALAGFNLGVEFGQLTFVLLAAAAAGLARRWWPAASRCVRREWFAYGAGALGMSLVMQRLAAS